MNGAINREAIETTGEVFHDGTMLELIRRDPGAGEASLLRWDGNSATIGQQFEVNGKLYRPPRLNSTSLGAIRLPGHANPCGSTRGMFDDIRKLLIEYTDIAENHVRLIVYFILGSWLVDRLLVAPFLFIIAPVGTPRAQLLRLLSVLCRRPLMLAEATLAAISSLTNLRPTILFDEPNLSRRTERLLYGANNSGRFAIRNGQITDLFSAKAIFSREPLRDSLLASQALQITLTPASRQVPFLEDTTCERIAGEFQSKLLQYRLTNLGRIRTPEIEVCELTVPMQDVARALASCVVDDEDLQLGVVQLLHEHDQDLHLDFSNELGSVILEALLFCCHSKGRTQVLAAELADIINRIWTERGEGLQTKPESVGWKLKALDLRTEPIDGAGKGLRLTEAVRARIHTLAQVHRIPTLRQTAQRECPQCKVAFGKK